MPLQVILPTIGSSGDVNPVIGLGLALKARGHRITVATNAYFRDQVEDHGLGFVELGTRAEADEIMGDPDLWHPIRGFGCVVRRAVLPNISRLYAIIAERRGPSSVVAATTLCLGARLAQERLGVPTASLHLQPTVFRSPADSGRLGFLDLGPHVPALVKRLFFQLVDAAYVDRLIGPRLNAIRAELGLGPVSHIFRDYIHSPELVLGLFPDWFAPPQPGWPAHTFLTGFVLHDEEHRELTPEAEQFLGAGPAPLLVTAGSAATDRDAFFSRTVAACASMGLRAMLVTNHPRQLPASLPPGVAAFPYLPFSRVLPRCSAIVHHGGIGTLAQAVRAGTPQLIVPNSHDQPDNGQRIERLGLGMWMGPLRYRRGAARALEQLLASREIRERCAAFAPRVDGRRSVGLACDLIEGLA
jgi:rhamnosyltransferase subunit B